MGVVEALDYNYVSLRLLIVEAYSLQECFFLVIVILALSTESHNCAHFYLEPYTLFI